MRLILMTVFCAFLGVLHAQPGSRSNAQPSSGSSRQSAPPSSSRQPSQSSSRSNSSSSMMRPSPSGSPSATNRSPAPSGTNRNSGTMMTPQIPYRPGAPSPAQLSPSDPTGDWRQGVVPTPSGKPTTARGDNAASVTAVAPLSSTPAAPAVSVNWMTLEQALEKSKTEKRKILIDVYTNWCGGWCKQMDSTTFANPAVAKYLNDNYYPVKFDAEQKGEIVFKDKTYNFKSNGNRGYHELAALWLSNRFTYPSVVFLDENQNVIQSLSGYVVPRKMEAILNYFGTNSHKTTPWETFERKFGK